MEVFLCERKLGREAIGDDDLQCFRVVCYALLRFTGVRSEMTLLILQHCFDPLYLVIVTTAAVVKQDHDRVA